MAKRRVGAEYSPSMLEPVRPGAVSPDRALCLPTFSHFLIVNKTSLSRSLSLPPRQRGNGRGYATENVTDAVANTSSGEVELTNSTCDQRNNAISASPYY
jgi:hypothetical protein